MLLCGVSQSNVIWTFMRDIFVILGWLILWFLGELLLYIDWAMPEALRPCIRGQFWGTCFKGLRSWFFSLFFSRFSILAKSRMKCPIDKMWNAGLHFTDTAVFSRKLARPNYTSSRWMKAHIVTHNLFSHTFDHVVNGNTLIF